MFEKISISLFEILAALTNIKSAIIFTVLLVHCI